jgi:hypothetical protein
MILAMSALACGNEASSSTDDEETSVVPGSTCEFTDDYGLVRLDIAFPETLNAAQIIAITRWSNADATCPLSVPLWSANFADLTGAASWENGELYVRQSEELLIEMAAAIVVVMDCPGTFLGAEIRLDTVHDGHGKFIASCTDAIR